MKYQGYKYAVAWIAGNDEDGNSQSLDLDFVQDMVSVVLIADLHNVSPEKVARDVIRYRRKNS